MKWLVLVLGLTACTKHVDTGEVCGKPDECGKGADCYHGLCTPMCAADDECEAELVCARHHCLQTNGEPKRSAAAAERAISQDVLAEIRAIHAELAQIREEQQKLREAIEKAK